jgi:hypothetical protein
MNPKTPTPEKTIDCSGTPRVNALLKELRKPGEGDSMDMTSLARQLERELSKAKELVRLLEDHPENYQELLAERDRLKSLLSRYQQGCDCTVLQTCEICKPNTP